MGFYIRKSISAGPFRFNLSGSGIGMSVGVKGLRIGTGPRGNYIHMGRGGLYYRASLGGSKRQTQNSFNQPVYNPVPAPPGHSIEIETGNVSEMVPSTGAELLQQINEKMATPRLWPWILAVGFVGSIIVTNQPNGEGFAPSILFLTIALAIVGWWWDKTRKVVVAMYDLSDEVAGRFERFTKAFESVGSASRIWNIDTAANTSDWKRNAGAGRLVGRKPAIFQDAAPLVMRTNVSVPCIKGGKQTVHFLPDCVLVVEGKRVGAISYEQFNVLWNATIFVETDGVPGDSQVVGHTWRFVNKNGGPDRRFNNNRQIPQVQYQQMGMRGSGGFQKILHLSRVSDRSNFDVALKDMTAGVNSLASQRSSGAPLALLNYEGNSAASGEIKNSVPFAIAGLLLVAAIVIYLVTPVAVPQSPAQEVPQQVAVTSKPFAAPAIKPKAVVADNPLDKFGYRGGGNLGNFDNDATSAVTEFYRHLEQSHGTEAAGFVIPEKREVGPLSAAMLAAKYSDLLEPLHLDNVACSGESAAVVRYSYMPSSGLKCVGLARVKLEKRDTETLISSIRNREVCRK